MLQEKLGNTGNERPGILGEQLQLRVPPNTLTRRNFIAYGFAALLIPSPRLPSASTREDNGNLNETADANLEARDPWLGGFTPTEAKAALYANMANTGSPTFNPELLTERKLGIVPVGINHPFYDHIVAQGELPPYKIVAMGYPWQIGTDYYEDGTRHNYWKVNWEAIVYATRRTDETTGKVIPDNPANLGSPIFYAPLREIGGKPTYRTETVVQYEPPWEDWLRQQTLNTSEGSLSTVVHDADSNLWGIVRQEQKHALYTRATK